MRRYPARLGVDCGEPGQFEDPHPHQPARVCFPAPTLGPNLVSGLCDLSHPEDIPPASCDTHSTPSIPGRGAAALHAHGVPLASHLSRTVEDRIQKGTWSCRELATTPTAEWGPTAGAPTAPAGAEGVFGQGDSSGAPCSRSEFRWGLKAALYRDAAEKVEVRRVHQRIMVGGEAEGGFGHGAEAGGKEAVWESEMVKELLRRNTQRDSCLHQHLLPAQAGSFDESRGGMVHGAMDNEAHPRRTSPATLSQPGPVFGPACADSGACEANDKELQQKHIRNGSPGGGGAEPLFPVRQWYAKGTSSGGGLPSAPKHPSDLGSRLRLLVSSLPKTQASSNAARPLLPQPTQNESTTAQTAPKEASVSLQALAAVPVVAGAVRETKAPVKEMVGGPTPRSLGVLRECGAKVSAARWRRRSEVPRGTREEWAEHVPVHQRSRAILPCKRVYDGHTIALRAGPWQGRRGACMPFAAESDRLEFARELLLRLGALLEAELANHAAPVADKGPSDPLELQRQRQAEFDAVLKQLGPSARGRGTATERLAYYCIRGLRLRRQGRGFEAFQNPTKRSPNEIREAMTWIMSKTVHRPFCSTALTHMLMDTLEGRPHVHIIDFTEGMASQWSPILGQLAVGRTGRPHSVRLTLAYPCDLITNSRMLDSIESMKAVAQSLGLNFSFELTQADRISMNALLAIERRQEDALVFMAGLALLNLPDGSHMGKASKNDILEWMRSLKPEAVIMAKPDLNAAHGPLTTRLAACIDYFHVLMASLEALTPPSERPLMHIYDELVPSRALCNILSCDGTQRLVRMQSFDAWHAQFTSSGFELQPLALKAVSALQRLLKVQPPGYGLTWGGPAAFLTYKGCSLFFAASWKPKISG